MKQKIILHVDMDAFFASCEEAINPSLRGKPLIVGGIREDTRSIVSCPNYLARARGIRTAMSLVMAMKLAPDGNFIRCTRGIYSDFSKRVREIFYKYTPVVEPMSIDEAYLDITDVLFPYKGDYQKLAFDLKEEVKKTLTITCSIGISSNKVCSKIASRMNKPDGITIVPFGKEKEFLHSLPVERIPGVGKSTLLKLHKYSIKTIGDVLKFNKSFYENEIGMFSSYLLNVANGIDNREVCLYDDYEQKSLSKETTLGYDTSDRDFLIRELYYLMEKACARLRTKKLKSKTITIKVKYSDFVVNQKSFTKSNYSNFEFDFYNDAIILLNKLFTKRRKIRLLGVRFTELKEDEGMQANMFSDVNKYNNLLKNVDKIRKKYNYDAIKFGKTFKLN